MHPKEITAFARRANDTREFSGKRVRIKFNGQYLVAGNLVRPFTPDRSSATIFDYDADGVGAQLEQIETEYGRRWEAELAE